MQNQVHLTKFILQLFFLWIYYEKKETVAKKIRQLKHKFSKYFKKMMVNGGIYGIK
jgi:hypothetical protein